MIVLILIGLLFIASCTSNRAQYAAIQEFGGGGGGGSEGSEEESEDPNCNPETAVFDERINTVSGLKYVTASASAGPGQVCHASAFCGDDWQVIRCGSFGGMFSSIYSCRGSE